MVNYFSTKTEGPFNKQSSSNWISTCERKEQRKEGGREEGETGEERGRKKEINN